MEKYLDPAKLEALGLTAWQWTLDHILVWTMGAQASAVLAALLLARLLSPSLARGLERLAAHRLFPHVFAPMVRAVVPLSFFLVWLVLQWFSVFAADTAGFPSRLIESVVSLLTAWVVIRFASGFVRDPGWARMLAVLVWSVAALNLLGLLDPTVATLDRMAFAIGDVRISVLGIVKAGLVLIAFLWAAGLVSRLADRRMERVSGMSPSAKVLFGKLTKVALIGIALVAALESVGIDLTALAVFGGAVGLGIGFGLQKVISNLVSGIILLMDKSVKPGDVIAIDDTFGWINRLSARYVSVITRDGIEHLIPNEDLISQRVENWSYTDNLIRLKLPVGVSYASDVPLAMKLAVEAAERVERVLKEPAPVCRLMNFGDDSVELELRIWISDPQRGVVNVRSEVLLIIWTLYHENGIEFPFAQRDLHIKSSIPLEVRLNKSDPEAD